MPGIVGIVGSAFGLGLWTILLFYNVTELAFLKPQLIWAVFLLGAIAVPARSRRFSPAGPYEFSVRDSAYRQRGSASAPSPGLARVLR